MLKIGPFKGYYYNTDVIKNLSDVIAPPYDVVNHKEREILQLNLHIILLK